MNEVRRHNSIIEFIKSAYAQQTGTYGGAPMAQQSTGALRGVGNFALNTGATALAAYEPIFYGKQIATHAPNMWNAARGAAPLAPIAQPLAAGAGTMARAGNVLAKGVPMLSAGFAGYGAYSANRNMVNTAQSLGGGDKGWNAYKQTNAYNRDRGDRNANLGVLGATGVGAGIGSLLGPGGTLVGAAAGAAIGGAAQLGRSAYNWASDKFTGYNKDMELQGVQDAMGANSGEGLLQHGMSQYNNPNQYKQKGWFGNTTDNSLAGKKMLATDLDKQLKANAK